MFKHNREIVKHNVPLHFSSKTIQKICLMVSLWWKNGQLVACILYYRIFHATIWAFSFALDFQICALRLRHFFLGNDNSIFDLVLDSNSYAKEYLNRYSSKGTITTSIDQSTTNPWRNCNVKKCIFSLAALWELIIPQR